jgi:hypothetical protein
VKTNWKSSRFASTLFFCGFTFVGFQREKQEKLNEVRCTVVMHLDQLQHLTPNNKTSNIMETLVFSKTRLSKLYKRVEELQVETEQQVKRHRLNLKHYARMETDCEYMAKANQKVARGDFRHDENKIRESGGHQRDRRSHVETNFRQR